MTRLHIGIIDLVTNSAKPSVWGRLMMGNIAAIMPQVVAVWCEEKGCEVSYTCYTGSRDLPDCIRNYDLVMISAFTQSAQMAYAISNLLRSKGAVTILGGPHARSFPEDAVKYFDYVLGLTNKELIHEVISDFTRNRPVGVYLSASAQPRSIPGVRQRWKYIELALKKSPLMKVVPMLASFGCPYSCNFCVDANIPYHPLDLDTIKEDLQFLLQKFKHPIVGWCDNNFGIHFNPLMGAIEESVPPGSLFFFAESSLSLLSEANVKRLKKNGFEVMLPGIESWSDYGEKSRTGNMTGRKKVQQVSQQVNMILSIIPYMQVNFLFPLDVDEGSEPFELTKQFCDRSPGVFPSYGMLTAYGRSAGYNLEYQKQNRVLPVPFHILDAQMGFNVIPKNYSWPSFYNHLIDLTKHTFSKRAIFNRYKANYSLRWKLMNLFRGITDQGIRRVKLCYKFLERFHNDRQFRAFQLQQTKKLPEYYVDWVRRDLGQLWEWLPDEGMHHDPTAYLKSPSIINM